MPETVVKKVDGTGKVKEIVYNGGSATIRVTDKEGVVTNQVDCPVDEATGLIQNADTESVVTGEEETSDEATATRTRKPWSLARRRPSDEATA